MSLSSWLCFLQNRRVENIRFYFLSLEEFLSNKYSFSQSFNRLWTLTRIFNGFFKCIYFTIQNSHRSIFRAYPSQPIFLFDIFKSINKTKIPLLEIFPRFIQRCNLNLKFQLTLCLQFLKLFTTNSSPPLQLLKLFHLKLQFFPKLMQFDLDITHTGKKLVRQELVISTLCWYFLFMLVLGHYSVAAVLVGVLGITYLPVV